MLPPFKRERLIYHIIYQKALQVHSTNDTTKRIKKQDFWQNLLSSLQQKLLLDIKKYMEHAKISIPLQHVLKRSGKYAIIYLIFFGGGSFMIGNTPLIALQRLQGLYDWQASVVAKCE